MEELCCHISITKAIFEKTTVFCWPANGLCRPYVVPLCRRSLALKVIVQLFEQHLQNFVMVRLLLELRPVVMKSQQKWPFVFCHTCIKDEMHVILHFNM